MNVISSPEINKDARLQYIENGNVGSTFMYSALDDLIQFVRENWAAQYGANWTERRIQLFVLTDAVFFHDDNIDWRRADKVNTLLYSYVKPIFSKLVRESRTEPVLQKLINFLLLICAPFRRNFRTLSRVVLPFSRPMLNHSIFSLVNWATNLQAMLPSVVTAKGLVL